MVSKAEFEKAQVLLNRKVKPKTANNATQPSIFSGFIVCSDCGEKMVRSNSVSNEVTYHKFICSTYKKYGAEACSCHLIQEDVLKEIVKEALNKLVFSIIDLEKRISSAAKKEKNIFLQQKEQNECKESLREIMNLKTGLYGDYKLEIITLSEYHDMKVGFEDKSKELEKRIKDIEKKIIDIQNENFTDNMFLDRFQPYIQGVTRLTRKMIIDFIEEIVVDNEKNIKSRFKFEDEIKNYRSIFDK